MTRQKHEDEERNLSEQGMEFIKILTERGYLADPNIKDALARTRTQEYTLKTYHNTKLLLKQYRDVMWSLECIPADLRSELDIPLADLDALIFRLDMEMSMENKKTEGRIRTIIKSRLLIGRINEALELLKRKPKDGQMLYDVIYQTYIADPKDTIFDVMAELGLTKRKYYEYLKSAISLISIKLWSSPDSNIEVMLELLSIFDDKKGKKEKK